MNNFARIVRCRHCGQKNRLDLSLEQKTRCGQCKRDFDLSGMNGEPVTADDQTFDQAVYRAPIPVLVDFWAAWCGPCRSLNPILKDLALTYRGQIKIVKVDTDANPIKPQQMGVQGIPALFLFDGDRLIHKWVGMQSKASIAAVFDRIIYS